MSEQPQPPKEAALFASIRQWGLVRGANGVAGGVVEGLGARIGLARVPARLLVVLAWVLLPGVVMLAYAAGWGLLPDQRGNIIIQNFGRGVTNVGALIGITLLTIFGFGGLNNGPVFGIFGWRNDPFPWDNMHAGAIVFAIAALIGMTMLVGVVVLIVWLVRRSKNPPPAGPTYPNTADAPVTPAGDGTSDGVAAGDAASPGSATPQPWEPALLPGDPRAGVQASAGARAAAASAAAQPGVTGTAGATGTAGTTGTTNASSAPHPTGAGHAAGAGAGAWTPPPPPPYSQVRPAAPAAPTVPGPGKVAYLAFGAVLLISAALAVGLERADMLAVSPVLAWGAAITVGLGAILVVVALAGRSLGFLGFISVLAVILAVAFAGNADNVRGDRDHLPDRWSVAHTFNRDGHERSPRHAEGRENIDEEQVTDPYTATDLTDDLAESYSSVFLAGTCVGPSQAPLWDEVGTFGDSMATMRLDAVDSDVALDATATYTRLAFPEGTNLEILGSSTTTVVWEERDVSCTMTSSEDLDMEYEDMDAPPASAATPVLSLTNPDAPQLTINAGVHKTIYLEEVAR